MTSLPPPQPEDPGKRQASARLHDLHGDAEALRLLVSSVTDYAIFMLDPQGFILTWNPGAQRIKGYTAEEIVGKHFSNFYLPADVERGHPVWELKVASETGRYEEEGWRLRKDGSRFWASVVITALRDEHGNLRGFGKVTRDLTERKEAEDRLRAANEELEDRVTDRTAELQQANEALRAREADLRLVTDAVPAMIAFLDTGACYRLVNSGYEEWFARSQDEIRGKHQRDLLGHEVWKTVRRHSEAALRGEPAEFEFDLPDRNGATRRVKANYTPHRDQKGRVQGFVSLLQDVTDQKLVMETLEEQQAELEAANEELQVANEELADQQLQLVATSTALREQTQTLETVNRIGQLLAAELDLHRLLQALTDAATEISEAEFGSFFYNTVDERGESYMLYTLSGVPREAFANFPMPRNTAIFAPTFSGEGTVRLDDVTRDPRYGQSAPHFGMPKGHLPVRSYLAIPVKSRDGEVLGGLFFGHSRVGVFEERHAHLIEGVAAQAAVALDNARLFEQARQAEADQRRRAQEAAVVAEVGLALSEVGELEPMLTRATEALVHYLDVPLARVWTLNEEEQVLELRAGSGNDPQLRSIEAAGSQRRMRVGESEIGRIAQERKAYFTNEAAMDPRMANLEWARHEGLVAFAGYPLLIGDRLLGVMALYARRPLEKDVLKALSFLADIVAQGLERKRLEDEVRRRAEELAAADRRKDEFLAMLGHELRNPLSPALLSLHLLKERSPEDPAFARARDMAERQLRNMNRIVDDLLDVSRITRGKIELRRAPLDLTTAVVRTADALRPIVEARDHTLVCSIPPEPLYALADVTRVDQVLSNLLMNATKYTDPGGTIWVSLERDGGEAVIRVRDTGVGIPEAMLPHLFDLFVQSERSLDRAQGGLGIGLTLVRRLVEMHGGTVTAASEGAGRGSEFTVRLPLLSDAPKGINPPAPTGAPLPPRSYRLLVVDDNRDAAESLAELLEDLGHTVVCAHDGPSALALAQAELPLDAILLDIGLPGLNGYEVAERLRSEERFRSIPLIALTGYGSQDDRRRSREAGFDVHLVKPIEAEHLLRVLGELGGSRRESEDARDAEGAQSLGLTEASG